MMPKAEYEVFEALNPFFELVMEGLRYIASAVSGGLVPKLLHFNSLSHPLPRGAFGAIQKSPIVRSLTRQATTNALVLIALATLPVVHGTSRPAYAASRSNSHLRAALNNSQIRMIARFRNEQFST
jgi:hypothetical protein